jgi:hypothetical protein
MKIIEFIPWEFSSTNPPENATGSCWKTSLTHRKICRKPCLKAVGSNGSHEFSGLSGFWASTGLHTRVTGFDGFGVTGSPGTATGTAGFHFGHRTWRIGPPLGSRVHLILSGLMGFSPWIRRLQGSPAFSGSPEIGLQATGIPASGRIGSLGSRTARVLTLGSGGLLGSISPSDLPLHLSSLTLCFSPCDRARGTKKEEK